MFAPKSLKPLYFFLRLAKDPNELDRVFQMRNAAVNPTMTSLIRQKMREEPQGRKAIDEKIRIGNFTMDELRALPEGSLGRAYADFMTLNKLSPEALPRMSNDNYVQAHLYETHDLWHVITGFGADVTGEAGLQAVYAAQLPGALPAALVSALLLNAALERSGTKMKERFDAVARGWTMGFQAKAFFGYDFRKNFARPLRDVRAELGIDASLAAPRSNLYVRALSEEAERELARAA